MDLPLISCGDYLDRIEVAKLNYLRTGPVAARDSGWKHGVASLPGIVVQHGFDASARIIHGHMPKGMGMLVFHETFAEKNFIDGEIIGPHELVMLGEEVHFTFACSHPTGWIAVALPQPRVDELARTLMRSKQPQGNSGKFVFTADAADFSELLRLSTHAIMDRGANPAALEDAILDAARATARDAVCRAVPNYARSAIDVRVEKALTFVASRQTEQITVEQMCSHVGVEYRTLLRAFQMHLHITPKRYIKLRQLNLVWQRLRRQEKGTLIADVASAYGVAEFGRFAAEYRGLFNELPSDTLGLRNRQGAVAV